MQSLEFLTVYDDISPVRSENLPADGSTVATTADQVTGPVGQFAVGDAFGIGVLHRALECQQQQQQQQQRSWANPGRCRASLNGEIVVRK